MGKRGGLKLKRRHETGFTAIYNMLNRHGRVDDVYFLAWGMQKNILSFRNNLN